MSETVPRLLFGCWLCVGVSQLQSADVSFDLTGPGAPPVRKWLPDIGFAGLEVFLFNVADKTLASLLPALPDRETSVSIAGEQRRHHRLVMYVLSVTK